MPATASEGHPKSRIGKTRKPRGRIHFWGESSCKESDRNLAALAEKEAVCIKLIHTSDWHLGRIFYKTHLTEDQAYILDQFIDIVRDERPDVVLIAGDVYDRSTPPVEAVELLDDTLSRIVLGLGIPTIVIAGNHDSPERLSFGSSLMQSKGLHIVGLPEFCSPIGMADESGPVWFVPLPYAEPAVVRDRLGAGEAKDHDASMAAQVNAAFHGAERAAQREDRVVAVAHAYVAGGQQSESERPLTLGGTGAVDIGHFASFSYVAMGHLHRPQTLAGSRVRYSGSLMKYSFDEADHAKSVTVADIDGAGEAVVRTVLLTPRRDVRRVEGTFEEVVKGAASGVNREDYILACLSDPDPVWDCMNRLRQVYPNVMQVEWSAGMAGGGSPGVLAGAGVDHRSRTELELFCEFWEQVTGDLIGADETAAVVALLEQFKAGREAAAS
jgi:exonuclease SbcD